MEFISVTSSLLTKKIHIVCFYGHECISAYSRYHLEVLTACSYKDITSVIGFNIEFQIETPNYKRVFSGYLISVEELYTYSNYNSFKFILTSKLGLLEYHNDFCIYKSTDFETIIKATVLKHGEYRIVFNITASEKYMDYCVQYNETDLKFIKRLCRDNQLVFIDRNESLIITTEKYLSQQNNRQLKISQLKRADYQLWNWKNNACYSNHPLLKIGDCINNKIITEIKHYADNTKQYYYQYLKFDNFAHSKQISSPLISGLQLATTKSNIEGHSYWDHQKFYTHTLQGIGMKPKSNSRILLKYTNNNPKNPYIYGAIYTKDKPAPYCITDKAQHHGFRSQNNDQIRFLYGTQPETLISSPNTIQFTNQNDFTITASSSKISIDKQVQIKSQQLIIESSTEIKLQCGESYIQITPHKIIIQSNMLYFSKPGIVT
jgi:hypothetical protein